MYNNNLNKNINLSGSIGYTLLEKNMFPNYGDVDILILADMHDELEYCKNNGLFISEWFSSINMKKKTKILLEEVPRIGVALKELWPSSPHTQKLKDLYLLDNTPIEGIDPRPFMIPYSWGLLYDTNINSDNIELPKGDDTLKEHCNMITEFYSLKHEFFIKSLKNIYNVNYLSSPLGTPLGQHFLDLKKSIIQFIKKNNNFKDMKIKEIVKTNVNIMNTIDEDISSIMEWYTIAKIFESLNEGITSFIIHAGLAHTTKLISLLKTYYGFNITKENGTTNMNTNFDTQSSGCLLLPNEIGKLFGGNRYGYNNIDL